MVGRAVVTIVMSRAARKVEHCLIYLYTALQYKEGEGEASHATSGQYEWNRVYSRRERKLEWLFEVWTYHAH